MPAEPGLEARLLRCDIFFVSFVNVLNKTYISQCGGDVTPPSSHSQPFISAPPRSMVRFRDRFEGHEMSQQHQMECYGHSPGKVGDG